MPFNHTEHHLVCVDLSAPKPYACSCTLRQRPCTHALALRYFFENSPPGTFSLNADVPDWARALLQNKRAGKQPNTDTSASNAQNQEKRYQKRLQRAEKGLIELETWLNDTLRRGLANAIDEDPHFFSNIATRLSDASLPGPARAFRLLNGLNTTDPLWPEKVAETMAEAYLAVRSFRNAEWLPETLLTDLEAYLGIAIKKEEVLRLGIAHTDTWAVIGVQEEALEGQLSARRQYLCGASGKMAVILDFSFGDTGFGPTFQPGDLLQGSLVFYPSAFPLRALLAGELKRLEKKAENLPGLPDTASLLDAYALAIGAQPWLPRFPAVLHQQTPHFFQNKFYLIDASRQMLPLQMPEQKAWKLIAQSGGLPVTVFGEWDGAFFRPF